MRKKSIKGGLMFNTDLEVELDGTLMNRDSIEGTEYVTVIKQDGNQNFIVGGSLDLNGKWIYKKQSKIQDKYNNTIGHKFKFHYSKNHKNYATILYNSLTDKMKLVISNIAKITDQQKLIVIKNYLKGFSDYLDIFEKEYKKFIKKNNKVNFSKNKILGGNGGLQFDFVEDITDKHEVYYPLNAIDDLSSTA
jgi:hypothetical protein